MQRATSEMVPPMSYDWSTRKISDGAQSKNRSEVMINQARDDLNFCSDGSPSSCLENFDSLSFSESDSSYDLFFPFLISDSEAARKKVFIAAELNREVQEYLFVLVTLVVWKS